ncbi:hypothetical protein BDM02DRAFT_3109563, partial [Thelephora ganbajun]
MSSDSSSLSNALGPDPPHGEWPQLAEDIIQPQVNITDSAEADVPRNESKVEKDRQRQRKRRAKEEIYWKMLEEIFGEEASKYDRVVKAGVMLGIVVPPKNPASKKRAMARSDLKTKEERKRLKKNENGKRETERMRNALNAVKKFYGMNKAARCEVLAKLVGEVLLFKELEDENRTEVAM